MSTNPTRPCPLCDAMESSVTFPYRTRFNEVQFNYLKCSACSSVFVDPVPDSSTFAKMYAKAHYHDLHYKGIEGGVYSEAATAVKEYLLPGATVLDYGCGIGAFMKALVREGFIPYGVEFDEAAARYAGQNANCQTFSLDQFVVLSEMREIPKFDAIHLGDVLEHLPDPARVLRNLLGHLKHDGILFVEGPLEINPSLVYWAARAVGWVKRVLKFRFVARDAPTHLFRTDARHQLEFFRRIEPRLVLLSWSVYETGWPYTSGGAIKRAIAGAARLISGRRLFGLIWGNRFRGVFRLHL